MPHHRPSRLAAALLAAGLLLGPAALAARAHFLWINVEAPAQPGRPSTVQVFLNETPEPGGPEFLKYVEGVTPTVAGVPLAASKGEEALQADWVGAPPAAVDAERDLGLKTKGDVTYRLYYTARLQTAATPEATPEKGGKLRARVIARKEGKPVVQVLFDGKPAARARIKTHAESGEGAELTADDQGIAEIPGAAEGKVALWANHVDPTPGELAGKPFGETRHYATLNYAAKAETAPSTAFATMPDPAVNSFGAAVAGDWLYAYSGHTGKTHNYSVETTSRHFRRLSLRDRTTWEELPMGRDVQGTALVSDGRYLYRTGGMSARNQPGQPQDLSSCADFARFDPESKTWTDLAPMPTPRSTHDSAIVGRTLYVAGGWTMKGAGADSTYLADAASFDLDHPDLGWKAIPQPFRRRALAVAEAGGKLYVLGGLDDKFQVTRRVDVYDPATSTWSTGPDLPGRSDRDGFAASAFAVDGWLHASGLPGTIVRLDAAGTGWEVVGAWAQPRNTHRLVAAPGHALLAVGGNYRGEQTPLIEAVTFGPAVPEARAAANP